MAPTRTGAALALLALLAASACSTRPSGPRPGAPDSTALSAPVRMQGTLLQYRPDEGTNRLEVELTNEGSDPVTVSSIQIRWAGVRNTPVTPKRTTYAAGQTIDLTTTYGVAVCDVTTPAEPVRAVATFVGGGTTELTLDRHGTTMLRQFRSRDCALERLHQTATVSLGTSFTPVRIDGESYLSGSVAVTRRLGQSTPVTVVDLTGSVLLTFTSPPSKPLPLTLAADQRQLDVPVLIGSTFRCDDHGRSQSTQTFLLSAYLRLGSDHAQERVVLVPEPGVQAQAQDLMATACR